METFTRLTLAACAAQENCIFLRQLVLSTPFASPTKQEHLAAASLFRFMGLNHEDRG